jgi:hypothetical protein
MLLHLESGQCECETDSDEIEQLAFECYQSRHYASDDNDYPFQCPTCASQFSHMSALFQHVESDYCDEAVLPGRPLNKFLRFLESRI